MVFRKIERLIKEMKTQVKEGKKMEKVRYVATWPRKVEVQEAPVPEIKDNEILVRVELSGICGTDLHVYDIGFGPHRISGVVEYPLLLGHEYIGIIEKKGRDADKVMFYHTEIPREGDRIYWGLDHYCNICDFETLYGWQQFCTGAFYYGFSSVKMGLLGAWSQYVVIKPQTHIWKMPKETVSEKEGVLIEPYIVGLRSVDRALSMLAIAEKEPGPATNLFLIQGAGTIGLMTLIALKTYNPNSTVIVTDLHKHRLEMAKTFGADYTINVKETAREERIKMIREIATSPDRPKLLDRWGVDCALDCTGRNAHEVINEGIEVVRAGGVYVEVGAFCAKSSGLFTIDPHEICARELIFTGNWAYPLSTIEKACKQVLKGLFKRVDITRIITHEHKLEETEEGLKQGLDCVGIKHIINPWK